MFLPRLLVGAWEASPQCSQWRIGAHPTAASVKNLARQLRHALPVNSLNCCRRRRHHQSRRRRRRRSHRRRQSRRPGQTRPCHGCWSGTSGSGGCRRGGCRRGSDRHASCRTSACRRPGPGAEQQRIRREAAQVAGEPMVNETLARAPAGTAAAKQRRRRRRRWQRAGAVASG